MKKIINPILKGFNPDPSIIRVEDDYYIATSTFEWFPGVQIHHSKDLINWELIAHPLNRVSQLDLKGVNSSAGIFAPCLSYCDETFYLVYTNVLTGERKFMDTHNYLVTTNDIRGEWSEPIYIHSQGFDPSLFHDNNGKKWIVSMGWDYRFDYNGMAGLLLQEYDYKNNMVIGDAKKIFVGSDGVAGAEGPHLYKKDKYYYIIIAEGGTDYGHFVTMLRSENIFGPYEIHPDNPVLTSINDSQFPLQKSGHADIVETQDGEWYMVHLSGRPILNTKRCILGRETCIQRMVWGKDGWLRLEAGGSLPQIEVDAPNLPEIRAFNKNFTDFDSQTLDIHFQSLRIPLGEDSLTLRERPGFLRLKGKESILSKFHQSLVARRQQSFCFEASTCLEFEPESFKHMAGLVYMYNVDNFYYLTVTHNEIMGRIINIIACDAGRVWFPIKNGVNLKSNKRLYLKIDVEYVNARFLYSFDNVNWVGVGPVLDASILSDDYGMEKGTGWFTGAFVGLCCQDLADMKKHADFDWFKYEEK